MYPPPIPTHGIRLRIYVATEQGQRVQTNKPDSREVPHFIRRQEGRAWMKFTISSFSVRKVFQNKHTVHTHISSKMYGSEIDETGEIGF
jgi:hypothetical protein